MDGSMLEAKRHVKLMVKQRMKHIVKRWMKLMISEIKKTTLDLLYPWKTGL
jgi:hypothetical protein